jgi:hypothetical protein
VTSATTADSGEPGPAVAATAPRRGRLRAIAANLALLGLALLVALLVGEFTVRLVAPQQLIQIRPDIWQPIDSLGWVNRPNVRTTINTGERAVRLFTDADGLRVGPEGRRDAPTRVLLIGDSFVQALQVDYEQTFGALLEAGLTARLGRPVAAWNAGVDGWDPPQYLVRARQLLDRYRFDLLVVAIYLGNDVVVRRNEALPPRQPAERHSLRLPRRLAWSQIVRGMLYPINDELETRSHLFVLAKNGLRGLLLPAGLTAEEFPFGLRRSEASSPRWEVTTGICVDLATAAASRGVPALFVLIPEPYAVNPVSPEEISRAFRVDTSEIDLDQASRILGRALAQRSLATLQVLDSFRLAHAGGIGLFGRVDRHLTPEGHQLLARLVEPAAAAALEQVGRAETSTPAGRRASRRGNPEAN